MSDNIIEDIYIKLQNIDRRLDLVVNALNCARIGLDELDKNIIINDKNIQLIIKQVDLNTLDKLKKC